MNQQAIFDAIQKDIDENPIMLYMKGTPDMPQCGFSAFVCGALKQLGASFEAKNVLADESLRQGIKIFSNWPTIPQLYVKGSFVGGCDIVKEMYASGELQKLLGVSDRAVEA